MQPTKKLPFQVIYSTSETDGNPASNIVDTSPLANGWLSLPNASFPQEVVLDFGGTVCVSQLKFVSHQCKIASNIDIFIGQDISNWRRCNFELLDSFQFSDNKQNSFRAREIRVAHLPMVQLRYIKLSATDCHQNRHNKGCQIGIISVVANGYDESDIEDDEEVMKLERLKQEAIEREDFDRAKELKEKIGIMRDNRTTLSELKQRKMDAIRNEDYDLAKRLKREEQMLIGNEDPYQDGASREFSTRQSYNQGYQQSNRQEYPQYNRQDYQQFSRQEIPQQNRQDFSQFSNEPEFPSNSIQEFPANRAQEFPANRAHEFPANRAQEFPANRRSYNQGFNEADFVEEDNHFDQSDMRQIKPMKTDLYAGDNTPMQYEDRWDERPVGPEFINDDDRPIRPGNGNSMLEIDDRQEAPAELDERQRREASFIIKIAGEEPVRKYFSKSVDFKIAGIREIARAIKSIKNGQKQIIAYEKFCQLMKTCIKENSKGAFVKAIDEIIKLTDRIYPPSDVVRAAIEQHKQAIFSKLSNKKVSQTAVEFFRWAAGNEALGVPFVANVVMAPLKQPIQWMAVLPRLEIIQYMIETYGPIEGCFEVPQIIEFVMLPLDSPKTEVRKEALAVLDMLVGLGEKNIVFKMIQEANIPNVKRIIDSLNGR